MQLKTGTFDRWTAQKIGLGTHPLTTDALKRWQWQRLQEVVQYAGEHSVFYRDKLKGVSFHNMETFSRNVPFTMPEELSARGEEMICVPQSRISRIVTLQTGGSSGFPKRVYFTQEDQALTSDFFAHGFPIFLGPEDCLMIFMPSQTPGSVGDLIRRGVSHIGATVIGPGLIDGSLTYDRAAQLIEEYHATSIVGLPSQMQQLARTLPSPKHQIDSVLLSGDYVPQHVVDELKQTWQCWVFEHYGMTEMGLGGAEGCGLGRGYHIREVDLYMEIIDPESGTVLPDGEWGEIVFTTLTRRGMPLIRYRTGDISRILTEPCPCVSVLRRLDRVRDRGIKKGWR